MIMSGAMLFAAEAVKCYKSPFFRVKLILIAIAGLNALIFHKTVFSDAALLDASLGSRLPWRARFAGACSLAVWIGVIAMGRGLAYA
jgi:hypothetical protein